MDTFKPTRRRHIKRPRVRRSRTTSFQPSARPPLLTPEMLEKLRLGFAWQESQQPTPPPVEIPVVPVQEKSIAQILLDALIEAGIETYKGVWKKTSPVRMR